jgi:hypothetical protein
MVVRSRRQVSTIETIAATYGPASSLPMWIQFLVSFSRTINYQIASTVERKPGIGNFSQMSANRPIADTSPRIPVGQAIAYWGTYTIDEAAKTFMDHIEGCTFPQWDGVRESLENTFEKLCFLGRVTPSFEVPFYRQQRWTKSCSVYSAF